MSPPILTPREAVSRIGPNDVVGVSSGSLPLSLLKALAEERHRLRGLKIVGMIPLDGGLLFERCGDSLRYHALVVGTPAAARAIKEGRADYIPCHLSEVPRLLEEGHLRIDVILLHLSPPDEEGYCSYGISVDWIKEAVPYARLVIGELNDQMPRTLGDALIHISRLHAVVRSSHPLPVLPPPVPQPEDERIAELVSDLVPDRATLQVGWGATTNAVLLALRGKRDLGVHSGVISDGIMELMECGAVTNRYKLLNTGKTVAGGLVGSERLYRFAHKNPNIALYPVSYVNDPFNLALLNDFIAINGAMEVDLLGQVNAEFVDGLWMGGVGGQVDFMRGASLSRGGKSIVVLRSTTGSRSRIVPVLRCAPVTTIKSDVHYVVTEYGIAHLRGRSLRERAELLISIAHPRFRGLLQRKFREFLRGRVEKAGG